MKRYERTDPNYCRNESRSHKFCFKEILKKGQTHIGSVEENTNAENKESFLICDDCGHNTIRYDPSSDGVCDYGFH